MTVQSTSHPGLLEQIDDQTTVAAANALKTALWPKFINDGGKVGKKFKRIQDQELGGALGAWPENYPLSDLDLQEGYAWSTQQQQYGAKINVTLAAQEFYQIDILKAAGEALGHASNLAKEIIFHSYFVYGHTAAASVPLVGAAPIISTRTADGNINFYNAHRWRSDDITTWSNILTTYYDPSEDGVAAMGTQVTRWAGPNDNQTDIQLVGLLYPPEQKKLVLKTYKTLRGEPGTANNAINTATEFLKGEPIEDKYLPSTSNWFGLTSAKDGRPTVWWGWKDRTGQYQTTDGTENKGVTLHFSMAHGVPHPNGWIAAASAWV